MPDLQLHRDRKPDAPRYVATDVSYLLDKNVNVGFVGAPGAGDREWVLVDAWRDFENLPRFMEHLVSVRTESRLRSHWMAKAPAGTTVEWDAEIVNQIPGELIAWKSLAGAEVSNAGSVHFTDAPGERGTIVRVVLDAEPPAGKLGFVLAKLFGEDPDRQVREDLRKLKQLMETGAIANSAGQCADSGEVGGSPGW